MPDDLSMETVPPTEQGALTDELRPSRWPSVIGVISLIYAILGLTCASLQLGWMGLMDLIPEMWRGGVSMPLGLRVAYIVMIVPLLVLGIMLVTGAVGLLRRRRSSVTTLRRWAIARMVLAVLGVAFAIVTAPAQIEMQRQQYDFQVRMYEQAKRTPPPPKSEQQMYFWLIMWTGIGAALILAYPLFIGLFLSRKKVNDEIAEWR